MVPVLIFLRDHKAETLTRVVEAVEKFAVENNDEKVKINLAAGNAGIEAATNIVIKQSERLMLILVYGIVALLVFWEFKSWRVAVCIMIPLYITSVLCEAIMARLGLGVKVATLPVIALGIGIGVDYGIYIYNRLEHFLERGLSLRAAYFETLKTTGAAVALTGTMLALGVATWTFSDIKFQADMGLLLTFIFLWNMIGAIVMIPALSALLLDKNTRNAALAAKPALSSG
jgi:predicted RND superfamily exporter protein